jgi:hypothetical protein
VQLPDPHHWWRPWWWPPGRVINLWYTVYNIYIHIYYMYSLIYNMIIHDGSFPIFCKSHLEDCILFPNKSSIWSCQPRPSPWRSARFPASASTATSRRASQWGPWGPGRLATSCACDRNWTRWSLRKDEEGWKVQVLV